MSTLVLLQGIGSLELLNKLLDLRTQAVQDVLQSEGHESVKVRVSASLKLLIHTVLILHACFLGEWIKSFKYDSSEIICVRLDVRL